MNAVESVRLRLRQVFLHLRRRELDDEHIALVASALTAGQAAAFFDLPVADQQHLVCVGGHVTRAGWTDSDLLQAALLHDIGKHRGGKSPNLLDRSVYVLLGRFAPGLLSRATAHQHWWNRGLYLAVHHPKIGAEIARLLGCNERACDLVARHADREANDDVLLEALQSADSAC